MALGFSCFKNVSQCYPSFLFVSYRCLFIFFCLMSAHMSILLNCFFGVDHTRSTECHPIPLLVCLIGFNPDILQSMERQRNKRNDWFEVEILLSLIRLESQKKTCLPSSGFSAFISCT